jgi:threonine/homoserine/homoserine lactone efflux protein
MGAERSMRASLTPGVLPLLRGLLVGLSIAAPVGPIGLLCIRRTLVQGRAHGLASGLGAATADAVYGCIAGFGLAAVSDVLLAWQVWLRLIGGAYLIYLGVRTFTATVRDTATDGRWHGIAGAYGSTLVLTLTNPVTIVAFAAVLVGLGLAERDAGRAALLVLGVFLGSALWWLALTTAVALLRRWAAGSALHWINRVSGMVIVGFGLAALVRAAA